MVAIFAKYPRITTDAAFLLYTEAALDLSRYMVKNLISIIPCLKQKDYFSNYFNNGNVNNICVYFCTRYAVVLCASLNDMVIDALTRRGDCMGDVNIRESMSTQELGYRSRLHTIGELIMGINYFSTKTLDAQLIMGYMNHFHQKILEIKYYKPQEDAIPLYINPEHLIVSYKNSSGHSHKTLNELCRMFSSHQKCNCDMTGLSPDIIKINRRLRRIKISTNLISSQFCIDNMNTHVEDIAMEIMDV